MGRLHRVIVVGSKGAGKTALLHQLVFGSDKGTKQPYIPTVEDTYPVNYETERSGKEMLIIYDTAGLTPELPEVLKIYFGLADAFVIVFSKSDTDSFNRADKVRKEIEKYYSKEKKDVPIVVLGTKSDLTGSKEVKIIDSSVLLDWAAREKVHFYEVTAKERASLHEPFAYLMSKIFPASKEPKFALRSRSVKEKQPGAAIVMDI